MSKEMENKNEAVETNNEAAKTAEAPKKGVVMRFIETAHRKYLQFRSTKVGRVVVGGGKVLTFGGIVYEAFKCGQRSNVPATVYIEGNEESVDEAPVEEPAENNEEAEEQK